MDPATYIIPLDSAHRILAVFGITQSTPAYDRWLRPDGVRLSDFDEVLFDSRFIFGMDWRGFLDDIVAEIIPAVGELGGQLIYEPDGEQGTSGTIRSADGRSEGIRYVPNEDDDFDDVIRAFQRLAPTEVEFRQSPANAGSDTWSYAVLLKSEWSELESIDRVAIRHFFISLK